MASPVEAAGRGRDPPGDACVFTDRVIRESSSTRTFKAKFHGCCCVATLIDKNRYIPRIHQTIEAKMLSELRLETEPDSLRLDLIWKRANLQSLRKYKILLDSWLAAKNIGRRVDGNTILPER